MTVVTPNFLYIGPDKAGSSWLHEVLITHPQVFMPEAKDLYFFDRYFDRGLSWYLDQFRAATASHVVVGEVCQDYLFHPDAPARIQELLRAPRFMVTLRDPADRAFSSYLYYLKHGLEVGSFLEALESEPVLLEHGRYATHLRRFSDRFGAQSLHVAVFDDLVSDPQRFIDDLTEWLGVEQMVLDHQQLAARLPAGRARSKIAARFVRKVAETIRERDGANVVGRVKRSLLVQHALYKPLSDDKPVMTDEERDAVHSALGGEVAELDRVYGLDLVTRWGWKLGGGAHPPCTSVPQRP